jgi:nucleoside-diphosphate-sugar epimerase
VTLPNGTFTTSSESPSNQADSLKRTVCIVGGSGFIGTSLVRTLHRNREEFDVVIVDKAESTDFKHLHRFADVRDKNALRAQIPPQSVLINLAAEHRDNVLPSSLYADVNVEGARNICAIASELDIRTIVFTSSVAVYGLSNTQIDESAETRPFNEYGRTKALAEAVYRSWYEEDPSRRSLIVIRPTVVFGEGNRGNVFRLLNAIYRGSFVMIGDGLNRKSVSYVGNVSAFIASALQWKPGYHIYNYVDDPALTMNEFVKRVKKILNRKEVSAVRLPYSCALAIGQLCDLASNVFRISLPVSKVRVEKFCSNSVFTSSAAVTGFRPSFTLQEALERTIAHEFLVQTNAEAAE